MRPWLLTGLQKSEKRPYQIIASPLFQFRGYLAKSKKMREDSIAEKLLAYKEHDTFNRYMDQDAFNVVLYPKILLLNEKYNFHEEYEKLRLKDTIMLTYRQLIILF